MRCSVFNLPGNEGKPVKIIVGGLVAFLLGGVILSSEAEAAMLVEQL
jgi:hypothetical protein